MAAIGYGKLAGGAVGMLVATVIVDTANKYLPTPLPGDAAQVLVMLFGLLGTWSTPHSAVGGSATPISPVLPPPASSPPVG